VPGDVLQRLPGSPASEQGLETTCGLRIFRQFATEQHRLINIARLHSVRARHQQLDVNLRRIDPGRSQRFSSGTQLRE
jgi:hypothetical protein